MLPLSWHTAILSLHVLAATIWVGGQLSLAALVPVIRRVAPEAPRAVARRFNVVAWSAFAVLLVTGVLNLTAEWDEVGSAYRTTLAVKLVLVVVSGVSAAMHARSRTPRGLAVWGALSALSAVAVVVFGVLLVSEP